LYDVGVPYQEWTNSAVSPAGTTQVKVEFAGYGGGSCWFDNAVLIESNSSPVLTSAVTLPFTVYSPASQTNNIVNITNNGNGTFMLTFAGTVGAEYCVETTTNLISPVDWQPLSGSTNTVTNGNGLWFYTATNSDQQRYFRSVVAYP
jgi:hypothetical protein